MKLIWDETKRLANLAKHGLDFAEFEAAFDFDNAIETPAHPSRTGRPGWALIGEFKGEVVVVAIV